MSKYKYNKDYFSKIDNPDKAYWFGFACADGYIGRFYKNEKLKSMMLEFSLQARDKNQLIKFNEALESNISIRDRFSKINDKKYPTCRIAICSTKLCKDLIDLGCTPEKTFTLRFPDTSKLPKEFRRDFLRGYFDGDGNISISEMAGKPHIYCSFSGTENIITDLRDILIEEGVIRTRPSISRDKRSKCVSFSIHGTDSVYEFLTYLYKDAHYYLDRKYEQYKTFYKDFNYKQAKRGIYWSKGNNAYVVTISVNNKRTRIGQTKSYEEALKMRKEAEIEKMKILTSPLGQ